MLWQCLWATDASLVYCNATRGKKMARSTVDLPRTAQQNNTPGTPLMP